MPRRSKKTNNSTDRLIQLNRNACDQTQNNVTSHIESIGNLIINELKGSERNHLKQQLLSSCISNITTISSRRSLKQVLEDLHTFDCYNKRQYRTIGIGDNDVNSDSEIPIIAKRKTRQISFGNSSQMIENEKKKTPNIITRTICTRSSKLNTLNNNQEAINHVLPNRARKLRSSLITETQISNREDLSDVKMSLKKFQSSVPNSTTNE